VLVVTVLSFFVFLTGQNVLATTNNIQSADEALAAYLAGHEHREELERLAEAAALHERQQKIARTEERIRQQNIKKAQYAERQSQKVLEGTRIAKEFFSYIQSSLETDADLQKRVLTKIAKDGEYVELVTSNCNSGINSLFGLCNEDHENLRQYGNEITAAFGAKKFPLIGSPLYRHDFSDGVFKGWRLEAYTIIRPAYLFVLIFPDTQLRIVLRRPGWLWFL